MKQALSRINLALRAVMELGIVAGLGYWGYAAGAASWSRYVLAIAAPVLVFGFWGWIDFRRAGRFAEPLRLVQELLVCALAVAALHSSGQPLLAWVLAIVSIIQHALVYALGERLLKR